MTQRTLAIDIGGTGTKAMLLGPDGAPISERARVETPRPATPEAVLAALFDLITPIGPFDRVSVGFPGVVTDGVTRTAHNLDPGWIDFDLAKTISDRTGKPTRVLNDAGVQGFGIIEGKGLEMVLTFGTGMGTALYFNGTYIPNLELAHHPFGDDKGTYEEYICDKVLDEEGKKKWSKRVHRVVAQILPIWNPRMLYLGGGNAKHIKDAEELPANVKIADNIAGLTGGFALWRDA